MQSLLTEDAKARDRYIAFIGDIEVYSSELASAGIETEAGFNMKFLYTGVDEAGQVQDGNEYRLGVGMRESLIFEGDERENFRKTLGRWDSHLVLKKPGAHDQADSDVPKALSDQAQRLRSELRGLWSAMDALWRRSDSEASLRTLTWLGGSGGILLSIAGFVCWYVLVQQHQDAIVRKQATAA